MNTQFSASDGVDIRRYMSSVQLQDFIDHQIDGAFTQDQSQALATAISVCSATAEWAPLLIPGRVYVQASTNIDRLVDTTNPNIAADFRIIGIGPGAGFYTTGAVTVFDSSYNYISGGVGNNPPSEFVAFENLQFESSSGSNASYAMSGKFLRVKYINCRFNLMACVNSSTYGQTIHFISCTVRGCVNTFVSYAGTYDVSFLHSIFEGNHCVFRSVDSAIGTNGCRFIDNLMEGALAISFQVTGFTGKISGNYFESQFANDFNFAAGTVHNGAIEFTGNVILNPLGATCYFGATTSLMSGANRSNSSTYPIFSNAQQITDGTSIQDVVAAGSVTDAPVKSLINGVLRFGTASEAWSGTNNEITKDTSGNFGINAAPLSSAKLLVLGSDQGPSNYAAAFCDSNGNTILGARDDRQLYVPALAAATGTSLVLDASGLIKQQSSSRRYKKDIAPIDIGLEFVKSLQPVRYKLIDGDIPQAGFVAEDFPDLRFVNRSLIDPDAPDKGTQVESINYNQLVAPLTKAIQELSAQLDELKSRMK